MNNSASKKITKSADAQGAVQLNELDPSTASASVKAAPKEPEEVAGGIPSKNKTPDEWETREHLNTIVKAHQIMSDPTKMAHVHKAIGGTVHAFNSLQDVRNYKNQKYGAGAGAKNPTASTKLSDTDDGS
jgi:hypothetical protein